MVLFYFVTGGGGERGEEREEGENDNDDDGGDFELGKKIGTKKRRKLQEKAEKKALREVSVSFILLYFVKQEISGVLSLGDCSLLVVLILGI